MPSAVATCCAGPCISGGDDDGQTFLMQLLDGLRRARFDLVAHRDESGLTAPPMATRIAVLTRRHRLQIR